MSDKQTFPTASALSVTTGVLLCPIDDVYKILNFLTGEQLYTHQLPRASRAAASVLIERYPWLNADATGVGRENWRPWLQKQIAEHGPTVDLEPLPAGAYQAMQPLEELYNMCGPENVVVLPQEPR